MHMNDAQLRPLASTPEPEPTSAPLARIEPSHIHIPRPSRLGQARLTRQAGQPPVLVQPEPALDDAA
jgi:hypothetical protein